MRLPALFRTTPFRLTLLFLALFAGSAAAFLAFIYFSTTGAVTSASDRAVAQEVAQLLAIDRRRGDTGLAAAIAQRHTEGRPFLYWLESPSGARLAGAGAPPPSDIERASGATWMRLAASPGTFGRKLARGERLALPRGGALIVAVDVSYAEAFVLRIAQVMWAAAGLVVVLGLAGGVIVSRNVNRSVARLNAVVAAVRGGDLRARVQVRGAKDEFDDLAVGLNDMLDRLERSIASLRHAGDAIAHDLRSPLTRLRTRLELALLDLDQGRGDPKAALVQAMEDATALLTTFSTVLAIARLQASGSAADRAPFDPSALAADIAELYEPVCEERGLDFSTELTPGLSVRGDREFVAQALANLMDNAVKYTPRGGAVMLRARRRASGEVEFSVTDTGPGVAEEDRSRIVQRFVRLENSRNLPGAGLGLSLVAAVAEAHGGRLELDEGPGKIGEMGPGLRAAVILPRAG